MAVNTTTVPERSGVAAAPAADASPSMLSWLVPLAVVIVGMFMSLLDTSIINVAIPTIQNEFGETADRVQWISTAYTLALGVVIPLSGWLGDRYGLDRVYTYSMLGFAAGSALCGLAWNLDVLIGFRVLQAAGGGLLSPITMSMIYRIVPRERIGTAMGIYGVGLIVAPAIGPTLGGYLVEDVNWRLIFYVNVPIAIVGAIGAFLILPRFPTARGERFDVPGFLAIAVGLFSLLLAFSEGQTWGWTSYTTLLLIALGLFSLAVFVVIELSVAQPILDMRVFRSWVFTNSSLIVAVLSVGLFAGSYYVPLFLQQGRGLGALQTGLILLPPALVTGVMMPIAGRLYDLIGPRWPGVAGLLILAFGTYLFRNLGPDTPNSQVILWSCVRSLGLGLAMMPIITGAMAGIPTAQVGRASSVNNIVQRVSSALGLAVLTAILTGQEAQQLADRTTLLPSFAAGLPQLNAIAGRGAVGVVGLYDQLQTQVMAGGLDDVFLLAAAVTLGGAGLAFLLPSRVAAPVPVTAVAPAPAEVAAPAPAGAWRPLPAGAEWVPGLALERNSVDDLARWLESGVLGVASGARRGALIVTGGQIEAAWCGEDGHEVSGPEARRQIMAWERGWAEPRPLPERQARAVAWLWTLPSVAEVALPTPYSPEATLERLSGLPGRVAVAIRGAEPALMLLEQGTPLLIASHRRRRLEPADFRALLSEPGRLVVRWSGARRVALPGDGDLEPASGPAGAFSAAEPTMSTRQEGS